MWQAEGVLYGQMAGSLVFGLAALLAAFRVVRQLGGEPDRRESSDWSAASPVPSSGKAALAALTATGGRAGDP